MNLTHRLAALKPPTVLFLAASSLAAWACVQLPSSALADSPAAATHLAATHVATLKLPVSLLDFMRASVEIPADGIWEAQSEDKITDDGWLLVDQDSVSLASAASLISFGGTGKKDSEWTSHADWQMWARDVQKTALTIRAAAKIKDQAKLSAAADHLQEVCASCHAKYRPEVPSDGVARYPFYPKREMKK